MTKQETLIMKGTILMMLRIHFFDMLEPLY